MRGQQQPGTPPAPLRACLPPVDHVRLCAQHAVAQRSRGESSRHRRTACDSSRHLAIREGDETEAARPAGGLVDHKEAVGQGSIAPEVRRERL